ncbi:MAG: FAD-binding oxidoreductase [Candidatus Dormibacteraeota bacterium]|nr:FAD-binding oxidoreductase [Candidatus Dormibacteraeota bacterium]
MSETRAATIPTDWSELRNQLGGQLFVAGEPDWDAVRLGWNLAADQRPVAVALPANPVEVSQVVRYARRAGLRVAVQGTGHAAPAAGSLEQAILLKTSRLRGLTVDAVARSARAEAGVVWGEVGKAADKYGLAGLAGSSPDVSVIGLTLGGGIGWLSRRYGLAANSVLAAEAITADGEIVRASATSEPDLFWALRGGGGSFAAVTALEFALHPVPEVYAGALLWPIERAADVLDAWRQWTETAPDEATTCARLLRLPPLPDIPEALRGRSFVAVDGAFIGDEAQGVQLMRGLRELRPDTDTFRQMSASDLGEIHMDPAHPVPGLSESMVLNVLTPDAIQALLAVAGPGQRLPLLAIDIRHLGGALAVAPVQHGVAGTVDGRFIVTAIGMLASPELRVAVPVAAATVLAALAPWDGGRRCLNMTTRPTSGVALFGQEGYERLLRIRARYDPDRVFVAAHEVGAGLPR